MSVAIALHVLGAIVWIGGMFFALVVLRPAAVNLDLPDRVQLWGRVFAGFFPWVWVAITVFVISGYWMVFRGSGGFAGLPLHVHLMQGIGWLMILVYLHLWFAPYKRLREAISARVFPDAAKQLNHIRILITINLFLGLINAVIGASGKYW